MLRRLATQSKIYYSSPLARALSTRGTFTKHIDGSTRGDVGGKAGKGMDPAKAKILFDEWGWLHGWGDGYSHAMDEWGYTLPETIAAMLAKHVHEHPQLSASAMLDAGAGDGLSGTALRAAGFAKNHITGVDITPIMLEIAGTRNCYNTTRVVDLTRPLPFESQSFGTIACVSTLTYVAPYSGVLHEFVRVAKPGALCVYNLRTDHEMAWASVHDDLVASGKWELVEKSEPLPYLPNNPDYGDKVKTVVYLWRVLGPASSSPAADWGVRGWAAPGECSEKDAKQIAIEAAIKKIEEGLAELKTALE